MLIYLDANIVIYLIEQPAGWGTRASTYLTTLIAAGYTLVVSHLTRLECRVKPLAANQAVRLAQFDSFFRSSHVHLVGLPEAVFDRATAIRAAHRFRTADALHLAAAIEAGCQRFLTNDIRLNSFTGLTVEVLP